MLAKQVLLLFGFVICHMPSYIVDGHGLNNETRRQLQSKKTKVTLY